MATAYPCVQHGFPSLCVQLELLTTPTGRYHGSTLILPSPASAALFTSDSSLAGSGPSRVRHRLFEKCLGDPVSLAILLEKAKDLYFLQEEILQPPCRQPFWALNLCEVRIPKNRHLEGRVDRRRFWVETKLSKKE